VKRSLPLFLAVALFMENMDATVIATSLPAIAADIGTSPIALKLAFTAYLVALAIFIPISGWMADRFGTIRVFRIAITVFIAGSLACAASDSLTAFVASRFLQGIGGAMMAPVARLVLVRATPRNQLVGAMAWLTIPALVGPIAGPPLGGFLTTYLSWHWIFLINVPIGALGILLAGRFLPKAEVEELRPIDYRGFVLVGLAFAGMVFGLSVISLPALPIWVGFATTVVGALAGFVYVRHARRKADPLLNLNLFEDRTYRNTIMGLSLFLVGMGAIPFLFPLMLQLGFGMTPFESGMVTFIGAVGALVAKFFAERLYGSLGFRPVLLAATVVSALLIAVKGLFVPDTPLSLILGVLLVAGLVRSSFFTGVNALAFADISDKQAGQATAIMTVCRPIFNALGVAVAGGILEVTTRMGDGSLGLLDFQIAFFGVAAISMLAVVPFVFLALDAGAAMSGHHSRSTAAAAAADVSPALSGK